MTGVPSSVSSILLFGFSRSIEIRIQGFGFGAQGFPPQNQYQGSKYRELNWFCGCEFNCRFLSPPCASAC